MTLNARIVVEVVFGKPDRQVLETVNISAGATCKEAVALSAIAAKFPRDDMAALPFAIWGKPATPQTILKDGDRIEILRPLVMDPRDARRLLAEAGQFMGGSGRELTTARKPESS